METFVFIKNVDVQVHFVVFLLWIPLKSKRKENKNYSSMETFLFIKNVDVQVHALFCWRQNVKKIKTTQAWKHSYLLKTLMSNFTQYSVEDKM